MSFPNPNAGAAPQMSPGGAAMGENLAQRSQMARNLKQAQYEMEGTADMFNRMSKLCFMKCVKKFQEPELGVGEMACMDRCVLKYMQTVTEVAGKMAQMNGQPGM